MRTIKFRGFACDKDDERRWIFGQLNYEEINLGEYENPVIVYYDKDVGWYSNHVYEDSVGQFTGAYDANDEEIYEGDIMERRDGNIYAVEWDEYGCQWIMRNPDGWIFHILKDVVEDIDNSYRVIGNMFENKDLMKGDEG